MDIETPTKKLAVGDKIRTAAEYASLPIGSVVRSWAVAERREEHGVIRWFWIDGSGEEAFDFDADAAIYLGEATILWIEKQPEPEPRWLSRDPKHIQEDLREGLEAALIAVHGDAVTNQQWGAAAMIVGATRGYEDSHECLRAVRAEFGNRVWGALLLHNQETKNSLRGQSEVATNPRELAREGLTVADLHWPNEVLHPKYQTH